MNRRRAGRIAQARGQSVEFAVRAELLRMGAVRAEILATPSRMVRGKRVYTAKVLADIVGWWPGGRSILCECKCREEDGRFRRPTLSDFKDHQLANLRDCERTGGNGLVGYLYTTESQGPQIIIEPITNWSQA